MKKILTIISAAIAIPAFAANITELPAGSVSDISVEKSESQLLVRMTVHPEAFPKMSNREVWLVPYIEGSGQQLRLDSVLVAGRTRYIQHERGNNRLSPGTVMLRSGSKKEYEYSAVVPYSDWMALSDLCMEGRVIGCAGCGIDPLLTFADEKPLAHIDYLPNELTTDMVEAVCVVPNKEVVKSRDVTGEAYIDFPVNQTKIFPEYRRNPKELAEIRSTIDAIRNDKDINITSISFKGYASPEGPYDVNERLAKGRTESLINYVRTLYDFPSSVMHSSYEAEDWEGLEKQLMNLNLDNKEGMLAVVNDNNLTPDQKDAALKRDFPVQYQYLLQNVYPSLRHSVYKVEYVVRNYTEVEEIAELMTTAPQKLSLDELFLYAQSLYKNSPEFREVMEVAVRMFPNDPEANLNAATTAAIFGDLDKAETYLKKAGESPIATYTAGFIAAQRKDFDKAKSLLMQAQDAGIKEATNLLETLRQLRLIE